MELRLAPAERNEAPLAALLVPGSRPEAWAEALERLALPPVKVTVFLLPGAKEPWGCLLLPVPGAFPADTGPYERCQLVENLLFIPERSTVLPARLPGELGALLGQRAALLHPALGLVWLDRKVDWAALLELPPLAASGARAPADTVFLPARVRTYQVVELNEEATLRQFEEKFPAPKPLPDKPLSLVEKMKLRLYKALFPKDGKPAESGKSSPLARTPGPLGRLLGKALGGLFGGASRLLDRMQDDLEDLEQRNQKEVDKLVDLLERDPLRGLQYALPLNEGGTARGDGAGRFQLFPRWNGSLFGGHKRGGGGGGTVSLADDTYLRLMEQYRRTAQSLISQGAWEQAAFVYLKLLKDFRKAAETLEQGGLYAEAASVYLRYCNDKIAAAQAYEKGHMYEQALAQYRALKLHQKSGGLCRLLGREQEALLEYGLAVEALEKEGRYLQASELCRAQLRDVARSEALLLAGWRRGREPEDCLQRYCAGTEDDDLLGRRLVVFRAEEVRSGDADTFLRVLRHLYTDRAGVAAVARELAYSVVLADVAAQPALAGQLVHFNPGNKQLLPDTMRYRAGLRLLKGGANN